MPYFLSFGPSRGAYFALKRVQTGQGMGVELSSKSARLVLCTRKYTHKCTVDSEIFARILFSRIALKDILVM